MDIDKPNVVLPLAESYNTRGIDGQDTAITKGKDQRKINSVYEVASNSISGQRSVYVAKRSGISRNVGSTFGVSTQTPYLVTRMPGAAGNTAAGSHWVIAVSTSTINACGVVSTTPIMTSGFARPAFVTHGLINSADTLVCQIRTENVTVSSQAWYSTGGAFTQITDSVYAGLTHKGKIEIMDGYAFQMSSTNQINNSNLNDLTTWPASNFITKSIETDVAVGLARYGNQIIAFGAETYEVFYNAGNATGSPLQSIPQLAGRCGLDLRVDFAKKTHYYCLLNKKMYFVGNDGAAGSGGVFQYNGSAVERISTPFIEKFLNLGADPSPPNWGIYAIPSPNRGAVAISLTNATDTTQRWLMYVPSWNEWFEWNSTVFSPSNSGLYFIGVQGGSGSQANKVYQFNSQLLNETYQDDGTDYTFTHQFKLPSKGNHLKYMRMCGVIGDTTVSTTSCTLNVSFSDDDWQTTSATRTIDMTKVGKKHIYRCGSYTDRGVQLTQTGNVPLRLEKFVAKIDE